MIFVMHACSNVCRTNKNKSAAQICCCFSQKKKFCFVCQNGLFSFWFIDASVIIIILPFFSLFWILPKHSSFTWSFLLSLLIFVLECSKVVMCAFTVCVCYSVFRFSKYLSFVSFNVFFLYSSVPKIKQNKHLFLV